MGGWDTHDSQGGAQDQLANKLAALGEGLDALASGLGDARKETLLVQAHLGPNNAALAQVPRQAPARWSQAGRLLRA